jgi:hypothetical protein
VTFDFNTNISQGLLPDTNGTTAWHFGVVSLVNVNETAGANNDGIIVSQNLGATGTTLTHADLNADDFVFMSETAILDISQPNYVTPTGLAPTGSTMNFYGDNDAPGSGSRGFSVSYAALAPGDISGGDTVIISSNGTTRTAASRRALVFDGVVPEPVSATLMLTGAGMMMLRRRATPDRH